MTTKMIEVSEGIWRQRVQELEEENSRLKYRLNFIATNADANKLAEQSIQELEAEVKELKASIENEDIERMYQE